MAKDIYKWIESTTAEDLIRWFQFWIDALSLIDPSNYSGEKSIRACKDFAMSQLAALDYAIATKIVQELKLSGKNISSAIVMKKCSEKHYLIPVKLYACCDQQSLWILDYHRTSTILITEGVTQEIYSMRDLFRPQSDFASKHFAFREKTR